MAVQHLVIPWAAEDPVVVTDTITWQEAVQALVVFVLGIVLAAVVRRGMVRAIDREGSRHVGRVVGRFVSVVIAAVGAVYALGMVGVRIGPLLGALGVGGIAIAFAAQDILQNFIAGVLLQVRHPFRVGDQIGSGDHEGVVDDVNLRTTVLNTYDGLVVYLPNAEVLKNPIINYTRTPVSRTSLTVGLPYDADLQRAREVLLQACRDTDEVQSSPPPEVWVEELPDSSINVAVRYWHPADIASRWRVRSAVAVSLKTALDAAGISIPFPQRVLWFAPESGAAVSGADAGGPGRRAD
ncbi:mechanosensitive ion channel family protein [Blastococcus capsensis]|uniref:mechanosensitive ion channel family protein n=1 Tax=Blastococcus capsensis TaxID=1564163 RepID=UPI002540F43E|nr:mechanosensitive ion channel family protein [Blastococcus capsensis]MDK3256894.1 mechanosensitive ion channel family protein [Blastococcus capsensis]